MKNISFLIIAAHFIIFSSCQKDDTFRKSEINDNIIPVISNWDGANIPCAILNKNNTIITVFPLASFQLNDSLQFIIETHIYEDPYDPNGGGVIWSKFIRAGWEDNEYLLVKSNYRDASVGNLMIFNAESNTKEEILDSTYNISSAAFYRNSDQLIYYSFGKPLGVNPGYYLLDRKTGEKTLLLEHISDMGPAEYINGFDVHPTEDILLIPFVSIGKSPKVVEYNLGEKTSDTLNVSFNMYNNRMCLWLRYNKTGEKILYSCYPPYAGGSRPYDGSEIGIINKSQNTKTILDVNTNPWWVLSINICPDWSPDDSHFIYCSAPVTRVDGVKGYYSVYMYKNIPLD